MKTNINDVKNWLGSDVSKQDLIELLTEIANGDYSAQELKKDVQDYALDNEAHNEN